MARKTVNGADLYIGTSPVLHINTITYTIPERSAVLSDELHSIEPDVIGTGGATAPRSIDVNVALDSTDTNGQVAMETAFAAGTLLAAVKFYPDGKTTGSVEWLGGAYVTGVPNQGADAKNKVQTGTYKLVYASTPAKGVAA